MFGLVICTTQPNLSLGRHHVSRTACDWHIVRASAFEPFGEDGALLLERVPAANVGVEQREESTDRIEQAAMQSTMR